MAKENLLEKLGTKGTDIREIVESLLNAKHQIPLIVEALQAEKSSRKYSCEKALRLLSEKKPEWIYPYFDLFASMLQSDNSFLKWGALITLANLTAVDREGKFEHIFSTYFKPLSGAEMITASNIVGASVRIVYSKPELADRIANEILRVETATYLNKGAPSPECRNVVIGQAIDTFDQIYGYLEMKLPILKFVARQENNPRKSVPGKVARFLRKYSAS
jgi:hypothetical protein